MLIVYILLFVYIRTILTLLRTNEINGISFFPFSSHSAALLTEEPPLCSINKQHFYILISFSITLCTKTKHFNDKNVTQIFSM